jgi:hypothetical protein
MEGIADALDFIHCFIGLMAVGYKQYHAWLYPCIAGSDCCDAVESD